MVAPRFARRNSEPSRVSAPPTQQRWGHWRWIGTTPYWVEQQQGKMSQPCAAVSNHDRCLCPSAKMSFWQKHKPCPTREWVLGRRCRCPNPERVPYDFRKTTCFFSRKWNRDMSHKRLGSRIVFIIPSFSLDVWVVNAHLARWAPRYWDRA